MPNHKSTWKRLRQDKIRYARNVSEKSRLRTFIKKVRLAASQGDVETARRELQRTLPLLDRAAKRRTIHPRAADRKKSRLQRLVNKLGR